MACVAIMEITVENYANIGQEFINRLRAGAHLNPLMSKIENL